MLFDEKELDTGLGGVTVKDAFVGMQILEKAAKQGVFAPNEFELLGEYRKNLVDSMQRAIGKNYDEEVAKFQQLQEQARQKALREQAEAAAPEASEE